MSNTWAAADKWKRNRKELCYQFWFELKLHFKAFKKFSSLGILFIYNMSYVFGDIIKIIKSYKSFFHLPLRGFFSSSDTSKVVKYNINKWWCSIVTYILQMVINLWKNFKYWKKFCFIELEIHWKSVKKTWRCSNCTDFFKITFRSIPASTQAYN